MTFVTRSQRQYQVLLSVNAGKRLGVALAVVNPDRSCQIASGAYKWHEIAPFLPKIDLFLGVYRGDKEYAQALELCERAREFGCDAAEVQPHFPLSLEFPTRTRVAERGLEFVLGTRGVRAESYKRRLELSEFTRMLPRLGERL